MLRAMKKPTLAAALVFAVCSAAFAAEVAGVNVPDTATAEGKTLKLNGAGLRKKAIFKVYVAGLYVENPTHDAAALLSSNQVKSMRLHMMRSLKGKQIGESIQEGFDRNSKSQQDKLKDWYQVDYASDTPGSGQNLDVTISNMDAKFELSDRIPH